MRKNHGKEEARARDLFYGLWINDLFMKRVESNQDWSLFCPNEAPGLADVWGDDFEALYTKYVAVRSRGCLVDDVAQEPVLIWLSAWQSRQLQATATAMQAAYA